MEGFTAQLLGALIGNIHLGIIVLDTDLRIQYWNNFVAERCAIPLEQACGRALIEVFPEAGSADFNRSIELARDKGRHVYNHWLEMPPLQLQTAGNEPALLN